VSHLNANPGPNGSRPEDFLQHHNVLREDKSLLDVIVPLLLGCGDPLINQVVLNIFERSENSGMVRI
jgi:hypothetical protein